MKIFHNTYSKKPYKRKIKINKKIWTWKIISPQIWIQSPKGDFTIQTDCFEVNGTNVDEYLDENYNESSPLNSFCPLVSPSLLKEIIKKIPTNPKKKYFYLTGKNQKI